MPETSIDILWGLVAGSLALLSLSVGVLAIVLLSHRRLARKDRLFEQLFDGVFDSLIIFDEKGKILNTNASACDLLDYSKEDFQRLVVQDLIAENEPDLIRPALDSLPGCGTVYLGKKTLLTKDRRSILVDGTAVCVEHEQGRHFIASFKDISERTRAEDELRESEERYRAVWEYSPVGICLTDKDGIYHNVNPAYCRLYGYEESELVGRPYYELIMKTENLEAQRGRYNRLFEDGKPIEVGEAEFVKRNGEPIWVQYTGDFVRRDDKPVFMVALNIDITEQKEIRELLLEERRVLEEKNAALHEILSHLEEEKTKFRGEVTETVDRILMPLLNKAINENGTVNKAYLDLLVKHLRELGAAGSGIRRALSKLTPREIEICTLIKDGATSKEISKTLNLSLFTVNKHRQRIRRKLIIRNKDINLTSYLRNLDSK